MQHPVKPLLSLREQLEKYPQSGYGVTRKHDIHTGVDIYTEEDEIVYPILPGKVVAIGYFTGKIVDSPWWRETKYVVIKSEGMYILYGEISLNPKIKLGTVVLGNKLSRLGTVKQVLSGDKDLKNPPSMLHIELYYKTTFAVEWNLGEKAPSGLSDPTHLLFNAYR
jgi:hypothetical protein